MKYLAQRVSIPILPRAVCAALALLVLAGCSAETKLTKDEQDNIKGKGPMSAKAQQEVARRMQGAQRRMQQSPGGPPAGAPAGTTR